MLCWENAFIELEGSQTKVDGNVTSGSSIYYGLTTFDTSSIIHLQVKVHETTHSLTHMMGARVIFTVLKGQIEDTRKYLGSPQGSTQDGKVNEQLKKRLNRMHVGLSIMGQLKLELREEIRVGFLGSFELETVDVLPNSVRVAILYTNYGNAAAHETDLERFENAVKQHVLKVGKKGRIWFMGRNIEQKVREAIRKGGISQQTVKEEAHKVINDLEWKARDKESLREAIAKDVKVHGRKKSIYQKLQKAENDMIRKKKADAERKKKQRQKKRKNKRKRK